MKFTYSKCGDYYIPNLTVQDKKKYAIGKYGSLRKTFLKKYHHSLYSILLMNGTLLQHLEETNKACLKCMESIIQKLTEQEGVTEELKAMNQMEWVRRMNSICSRAEEFVLKEFVYYEDEN